MLGGSPEDIPERAGCENMGVARDEPLWRWWLFMLFMELIPKEPGREGAPPEYSDGPGFHDCMLEESDDDDDDDIDDLFSIPGLRDVTSPADPGPLPAPGTELRTAGAEVRYGEEEALSDVATCAKDQILGRKPAAEASRPAAAAAAAA